MLSTYRKYEFSKVISPTATTDYILARYGEVKKRVMRSHATHTLLIEKDFGVVEWFLTPDQLDSE